MLLQNAAQVVSMMKEIQFDRGSAPQRVQIKAGDNWLCRRVQYDGFKVKIDAEYYDPEELVGLEVKVQ